MKAPPAVNGTGGTGAPPAPSAPAPAPALAPAATVPPGVLHAAFLRAFADYLIGPFQVALAQWPGFLARQGVDLPLSRVALDAQGQPLAFAFVAPRPDAPRWRLATMGALPAARGSGAAKALLDDTLARAGQAGQQALELEVFAQNTRALALYQGRGFQCLHALHGYEAEAGAVLAAHPAPPTASPPSAAPRAVGPDAWLDWLQACPVPDLPLQVTPASLRHAAGLRGWQCGSGQLVASLPDEQLAVVNSLVAPDPADASALLRALAAEFPARRLRIPQLQRADLGGAAALALGFTPLPLHQWLMRRPL